MKQWLQYVVPDCELKGKELVEGIVFHYEQDTFTNIFGFSDGVAAGEVENFFVLLCEIG